MKIISFSIMGALLAPCVTPHGLALDHLPRPWVVQVVTASSTAAIVKANDLITGRLFTISERDYRRSTIWPST
jgi:hypothetical protein